MLSAFLHLALIHLLMAMLPGPNTVAVSYFAATRSRSAGFRAAAGVAAASFIWLALSLAGVGTFLLQAGIFYRLLRIAGAAYLIYIAIRMILARRASTPAEPPRGGAPFRSGFMTTLSNPKSAVFWTSVFALVLPATAPPGFYLAVIVWITLQAFAWYGLVALFLSTPLIRRLYSRAGLWLGRIAGGFMLLFGLKILDEARRT
ncbi:LysE family transporter [Martelella sp. HB161492]|uniref:LysE family translocator n=1 Tax=Martelella sp. HB161492 TaxID=2720726 RepID=UPI001591F72C|nr:LysE family transporter [Martelella sp. HB161492]